MTVLNRIGGVDYLLTPEKVAVVVLSFASFGHHLPGFLRAYGDRELFRRYRWRFLLALAPEVEAALKLHGQNG